MARKPAVDGFIPRRSPGSIGEHHIGMGGSPQFSSRTAQGLERRQPPMPSNLEESRQTNALTPTEQGLNRRQLVSRDDVDASLREIDQQPTREEPKRKARTSPRRRKNLVKRVVIVLLIVLLFAGAWMGVKALLAGGSIFKGDIFGIIQAAALKEDDKGRTNVLIFGTSEDDEGGDHPGALLTDSMMVLSVDQDKKDAYMVSLPRDLWVDLGGACSAGYQGKLNELYNCYSDGGSESEAGAQALAKKASEITGLDVQYNVHVNYTVVREAVDAVDGITVKIESSDPRGILDRNFDWKCNYDCYFVKYKNGEVAEMDGEHALAFMRARNAQGGYGLAGGNFDREQNQQKVIKALREKALSAGTLSNPAKVTGLMDALGSNLRTNFQTSELRTLMSLATDIQSENISSINLAEGDTPVMTTANLGGVSIVRPIEGLYDYTGVISYVAKQISADPAAREGAAIVVLNGSGVPGAAKQAADKLSAMGFTIADIGDAPAGDYARRVVYQSSETEMPATRAKLSSLYGAPKTGISQFRFTGDVDFVVVIGKTDTTQD